MNSGEYDIPVNIAQYKLTWSGKIEYSSEKWSNLVNDNKDYVVRSAYKNNSGTIVNIFEDVEYDLRCYVEDSFQNISTSVSSQKHILKHIFKLMVNNPIMDTDFDKLKLLMNRYQQAEKALVKNYNTVLNHRGHYFTAMNGTIPVKIYDSYNGFAPNVSNKEYYSSDFQFMNPEYYEVKTDAQDEVYTALDRTNTERLINGLYAINPGENTKFNNVTLSYDHLKEAYKGTAQMINLDTKDADPLDIDSSDVYDPSANISDLTYELSNLTPFSGSSTVNYNYDKTAEIPGSTIQMEIMQDWDWISPIEENTSCKESCMGLCSKGCYNTCVGGCKTCCGSSCEQFCG